MVWHPAPAIVALRSAVNAMYPNRDKTSDGIIGDVAHGNRVSDHNPDYDNGGIVRAFDIDEDLWGPGHSTDGPANALVEAIIADSRTAYVIYEGRIWQNPDVFANKGWRKYTGVNSHAHHVHVSIRRGRTWDQDNSPWVLAPKPTQTITEEDEMFVLKSDRYKNGVLFGGGGVAELRGNVGELDNLRKAGVKIVDVTDLVLAEMIRSARGAYTEVGTR